MKCHSQESLLGIFLIRFRKRVFEPLLNVGNKQEGDPRQKPSGMTTDFNHFPLTRRSVPPSPSGRGCNDNPLPHGGGRCSVRANEGGFSRAFTLIELLVVVLIIGILAAIALPQYNKAVEKSKAVQAIALVKALGQAAQMYYLEYGKHPDNFYQLEITLSDEQKNQFLCDSIAMTCNKKEWGVGLYEAVNGVYGVVMWRNSGLYKGGGFAIYYKKGSSPLLENQLYCLERLGGPANVISKEGIYCKDIFGGKYVDRSNNSTYYLLP